MNYQTIYFRDYFSVADEWLVPIPLEKRAIIRRMDKRSKKLNKYLNAIEMIQLRNYQCGCGRSYVEKGSLQRHQRYECGKPPSFQCIHCSYASHLRSNLNRHTRSTHLDVDT